jgi:GTPase SAR1 family protein
VLVLVPRLRKLNSDPELLLPQVVVFGDQSSGKSSIFNTITRISFPIKENLCTRYATKIILRRVSTESLTDRVIPDNNQPQQEREKIQAFWSSISDLEQLPSIMAAAMKIMGIDNSVVQVGFEHCRIFENKK